MAAFQITVHASRSASVAARYAMPTRAGWRPPATASGVVAPRVAARRPPGGKALQLGLHERVEVAVEHGARARRLVTRSQVLDHLVGVQHVGPDLVPPPCRDVLSAQLA